MTPHTPTNPQAPAGGPTVTFIRFTLQMLEPGGVSVPTAARHGEVDVVPDVDCHGVAHIPGTSMAGALRARAAGQYGEQVSNDWFGQLLDPGAGEAAGSVDAVASQVWVLGSELVSQTGARVSDDQASLQDRWSTAIDRRRGAARVNSLRGARMLARDSRIEVFLRWDNASEAGRDQLLALISGWQPLIGRGTSRGLGRCTVESVLHGTLDLTDPADLLAWLTRGGPALVRAVATQRRPEAARSVPVPGSLASDAAAVVEIPASIVGPLHIGGGGQQARKDDDGHDIQVLLREHGNALVPGAGLKGVIRSRVEFILASVGLRHLACVSSSDTGSPCGHCWACSAFGHGGTRDTDARSVGRRAGIRFCDALISDAATRNRTHVAIDRFTGGAMDGLLYTVEALESGRFVIRIEIGATHADDAVLRAALRLALQDLHEGRIGLGAGTSRGYGSVRLDLPQAERAGVLPDVRGAQAELRRALALTTATDSGDTGPNGQGHQEDAL